jgi:hypothetical protein
MNIQLVATIIQAGSELIGEVIRNRAVSSVPIREIPFEEIEPVPTNKRFVESRDNPSTVSVKIFSEEKEEERVPEVSQRVVLEGEIVENKATAIATGCVPCSLGHVGTCSGLLNEATRFANTPEGAGSSEVIDRVNMCLDELNSLEREDLRPEKVNLLTGWEKELALDVLKTSRSTRHKLEDVSNLSVEGLNKIAGETQAMRNDIGRRWFQAKLSTLSKSDQDNIKERIMQRLAQGSVETPVEAEPVEA